MARLDPRGRSREAASVIAVTRIARRLNRAQKRDRDSFHRRVASVSDIPLLPRASKELRGEVLSFHH